MSHRSMYLCVFLISGSIPAPSRGAATPPSVGSVRGPAGMAPRAEGVSTPQSWCVRQLIRDFNGFQTWISLDKFGFGPSMVTYFTETDEFEGQQMMMWPVVIYLAFGGLIQPRRPPSWRRWTRPGPMGRWGLAWQPFKKMEFDQTPALKSG